MEAVSSEQVTEVEEGTPSVRGGLYLILFVLSILSLAVGAGILLLSGGQSKPVFRITVEGNLYLAEREVLDLLDLTTGGLLPDAALSQARERLLLHPAINEVRITRDAGGGLQVLVVEGRCAGIVRADGKLHDVDQGLNVLSVERSRCTGVPLFSGPFQAATESFEDGRLRRLMTGWRLLTTQYPELALRISEVRLNSGGRITLFSMTGRVRVELSGGLHDGNIQRLYGAFAYLEKEGFKAGLIDLRGNDALFVPER